VELKEVFQIRRSVNFFDSSKTINESTIRKIYEIARLCPSSFNLQPWRLILVTEPDNKKTLRECALNQPKVEEASIMLIVLADKEGGKMMDEIIDDMVEKGYHKEEERQMLLGLAKMLYEGEISGRGLALRNAGLFGMSFMLAAKDIGIDTHPMDGFEQEKVKKAFNIPDRYEVAMLIAVGFYNETQPLLPRLKRKDFEDVVVRETF
jgi:nitroreductase